MTGPKLTKFESKGKFGLKSRGKIILPAEYSEIGSLAHPDRPIRVCNAEGKHGFVNALGEVVAPCIYDEASGFAGLEPFYPPQALVGQGGLVGTIGENGEPIIPCEYDHISHFITSSALAQVYKDGKFGFIDYNNEVIHEVRYDAWMLINVTKGLPFGKDKAFRKAVKSMKAHLPFECKELVLFQTDEELDDLIERATLEKGQEEFEGWMNSVGSCLRFIMAGKKVAFKTSEAWLQQFADEFNLKIYFQFGGESHWIGDFDEDSDDDYPGDWPEESSE